MSLFNISDIRDNCARKISREETTWEDNIKMGLKDVGCADVEYIEPIQVH
jgi:hypothetical protein